jgi:hypothetical protein
MHWDRATVATVASVFRTIIVTSFCIRWTVDDHARGPHLGYDHDSPFNPIPGRHT